MADTHVGSLIGQRYRINDKLGEGGMSVVWLARDARLERLVAIKEIKNNASDATHIADVDTMRKEAFIMKDLDHPNIVHVHDIIDENGALYVVMDYVPGKDLAKVMTENRATQQSGVYAYAQDAVIEWGKQLCSALGYLHEQTPPIIYRDMKPGNVMLQDDGSIKIIDFGIAREFKPNQSLDTKPLGTRGYASPEAAEKSSQTDARSDVYSLGVTLFHLVTGHSPMEYVTRPTLPPIREINPALSPALEAIIIKSNQWDPALRQQSMAEMELELELLEDDDRYKWMRRTYKLFKGFVIAGAVLVVLGVACLVGSRMVRNASYSGLLEQAAHASLAEIGGEPSEAERLYLQAMELNPTDIVPYQKLVNEVYIDDNMFSETEESRWRTTFSSIPSALVNTKEYAKLCYQAGLDYFTYLETSTKDDVEAGSEEWDAAQDEVERGKRAAVWFGYALDAWDEIGEQELSSEELSLYATAKAYRYIGEFEDHIRSGSAVDDRGTLDGDESHETTAEAYRSLFNTLSDAVQDAPTQDTRPLVKLRLYHVVARALAAQKYVNGFRNAVPPVKSDELMALVAMVQENNSKHIEDANNEEVLASLYTSTEEACNHAKEVITKVYGAGSRLEKLVSQSNKSSTSAQTKGDAS